MFENITRGLTAGPGVPHVGEVMSLWTYYTAGEAVRASIQTMLNHTTDVELKQFGEHFVDEILEQQLKKLTTLMQDEGIPFSGRPPEVPKVNEQEIPPGVKLTDAAIANRMVADFEGLAVTANATLLQAIRDDIGAMFLTFHGQLINQGRVLKKLMHKRGWLQVPPPYHAGKAAPQ